MKILAIDTATEACSVALLVDDKVKELFEIIPRQHTERVLPMVDELLKASDIKLSELDAIAFDCGPGSFTGVRVGTSVIQGLAFSINLPVIAVSSLAALAQLAYREEKQQRVLSMIDARMNEAYWGCYEVENGIMTLQNTESVSNVKMIKAAGDWHCQGSGWDTFRNELEKSDEIEQSEDLNKTEISITSSKLACFPHAQDVAVIAADLYNKGKTQSAEEAIPTYVRNEVTWKKLKDQ